ncbi:hypothetical protein [Tabrizicola sp.]|jgi:hypothetical protein|uniref:hypothetical protein n=1 Tax=Tabrizicola sp. TaxID=2005166 RepID=UPI002600EC0F|nr:hypothetical protein [Tabrizicola sp.]MDK2773629.1 hypothetical protein [Tabrizicola sp.]
MRTSAAGVLCLILATQAVKAQQTGTTGGPLSAIDWLSQSVATPTAAGTGATAVTEPPVAEAGTAVPAGVTTSSLDAPSPDAVGLIRPAVSGLPRDLWGAGLTREIAQRLIAHPDDDLPALRQLFLTLLLAEVEAPVDSGGRGELLQVRIDKLMALGALEQAAALIDAAGATTPELFRRAFDVALLTGSEDRACQNMANAPYLAPTVPARIFCLARSGDWETAALTIRTSRALGQITPDQEALLSRFLDPDLYEGEPVPAAPDPVTPLDWMIYAAIGEPLPTESLPIAFSYAEIGPRSGWKARIEAAERLTRAGTIPPNVILGLYTDYDPAASGGVWDRVAAFQAFDAAVTSGDPARIAATLPEVWSRMQEAELEVPFATLFGKALVDLPLSGDAAAIAFRIGLLSPYAETVAKAYRPATAEDGFLVAIAMGTAAGALPPDSLARAISAAFRAPVPSVEAQALLDGNRKGEAIIAAIDGIGRGVQGDLRQVTEGLSLLRLTGLESVARRTALELMILERRG